MDLDKANHEKRVAKEIRNGKNDVEGISQPLLLGDTESSFKAPSITFGKISSQYQPSLPASSEVSQIPPYGVYGSGPPTSSSSVHGIPANRPFLTSQPSIISTGGRSFFHQKNSISMAMQQGVDENIYHWKVLNLSRAKLKASSRTSALLSGFAMVAMVEIQIEKDQVPVALMITFAVCTVLLIAVHMLALMISTCILPNVEAVANLHFQTQKTVFESPHSTMTFIVELAWIFSTVLGILLFLVEIAILCWVKFYSLSQPVAWVATGILIPIFFIFIAFAAHFYVKLVSHGAEVIEGEMKELEMMQKRLEKDVAEHGVDGAVQIA